eukprot:3842922-Prymnesium_polylepis.2
MCIRDSVQGRGGAAGGAQRGPSQPRLRRDPDEQALVALARRAPAPRGAPAASAGRVDGLDAGEPNERQAERRGPGGLGARQALGRRRGRERPPDEGGDQH